MTNAITAQLAEALEDARSSVVVQLNNAVEAFRGYPQNYSHLSERIAKVDAALAAYRKDSEGRTLEKPHD